MILLTDRQRRVMVRELTAHALEIWREHFEQMAEDDLLEEYAEVFGRERPA